MYSNKSKRGEGDDSGWGKLAAIILLVTSTLLLIGVLNNAFAKSEDPIKEGLCKSFNAFNFALDEQLGMVGEIVSGPRACKTIEKGDLPTKKYREIQGGYSEGAKTEVRDLMASCWNMWLEGRQKNVFDSEVYQSKNGCFVCYTFSLEKGTSFSTSELLFSLNSPYKAIDSSERCSSAGGKCGTCAADQKAAQSSKCPPSTDCCIKKDPELECENRGGSCKSSPVAGYELYPKWKCPRQTQCYVKNDHFISYLDYIQGTRGAEGGSGLVLFKDLSAINSNDLYAITFISPGKSVDWTFIAGTAGTLAAGAAISVVSGGILTPLAVSVAGYIVTREFSGSVDGINYIMVSPYKSVSASCVQEVGVPTS